MPLQIPTAKEIAEIFLANYESVFGQTVPIHAKAFLRAVALTEGMIFTQLYKYGIERALQNFALTATGSDLDEIGNEYGVARKQGTYARFDATVQTPDAPGEGGITFDEGLDLIGDSNGKDYEVESEVFSILAVTTVPIIARETGTESNLQIDDTLTFVSPPRFSGSVATVSSITEEAIDDESEDSYRHRVLAEIRTVGGGGNYVDYRRWAEEVFNVFRAFPYSGKPFIWKLETLAGGSFVAATKKIFFPTGTNPRDIGLRDTTLYPPGGKDHFIKVENSTSNDGTYRVTAVSEVLANITVQETIADESMISVDLTNISLPGDRTVFIEAIEAIDPDGIPPQNVLDEARDSINTDPVTGQTRPPLGETDQHLFVIAITRRDVFVEVTGLSVDSTKEASAKSAIQSSVSEHLKSLVPYIDGLSVEIERNDRISSVTISQVINDVLKSFGGFAEDIRIGLEVGVFISSYQLTQGELAKLGSITYV
jgi:hypothetical protein